MKATMLKDIQKTIKANMSGMVADEMKEFIDRANIAFDDVDTLTESLKVNKERAGNRDKEISELKSQLSKYKDISKREVDLKNGEQQLSFDNQILSLRGEMLQSNADNNNNLLALVFKNQDAKAFSFRLMGNADIPNGVDQYNNPVTAYSNVSLSGTANKEAD